MAASEDTPERPIITTSQAKAAGLKRYFSGRPCVHGHLAERLVSNGTCVVCTDDRLRAWVVHNKDKRRAAVLRHAAKDPEGDRVKRKAYYESTKEHQLEKARAWVEANPKKSRSIKAAWKKRNPHQGAADTRRRFAAERRACPAWADHVAILAIYTECARITRETGIAHHVDHIVPLRGKRVTGLHVHYNLQILDARVNMAKGNRMIPAEGVRPKRLPRQPDLFLGVAA